MIWETSKQFLDKYIEIKKSIIAFTDAHKRTENKPTEYENHLEKLKHRFGKEIRSVRQLDAARDVQALIYLLEKRLLLGWFNVEPLKAVIQEFEMEGGSTFNDLMDYREKLTDFMVKNKEAFSSPPYDPDIFCEVPANREVIPAKISEWICSQMGPDWEHFGRELINADLAVEGQLDELKRDKSLADEEKTRRLLDILVKGDKRTKRSQLSKLLKSIHRNDLDEEVESMFLNGCLQW